MSMKSLTLLRHAKSASGDPTLGDFDRPLDGRGQLAARAIGRAMRMQGLRFDRALASPAARIRETIENVAKSYGTIDTRFDERIYLASPDTLIQLVRDTPDAVDSLLIVGHSPGLPMLAHRLTRDDAGGLRARLGEKYPTATLAEIALPIGHWRDVADGIGSVERFIRPRDLDPALGPDME
jgi:phosphohistidine phosphatase